ncbi:large ribosomal subunit protein mL48 [Spinachia spinachia]
MSAVLRKVCVTRQASALSQALAACWAARPLQHPVWAPVNTRHYRSMPTHGIGRWRHLVPKEKTKKKKDKIQMKEILGETDTAYGSLNVTVSGYDMTLVEHYSQYIHNLCHRLAIKVAESYILPTKTTEVMLMQEKGTKMFVDAVLKTHQRVVQLSSLDATACPVLLDVLLQNQPEGVELCVSQHTEAHFQARFKGRPELEGLIAQLTY